MVVIAAVGHGASLIEKHFAISESDGGVDSKFSLEPKEMSQLVIESKKGQEISGESKLLKQKSEKISKVSTFCLYIKRFKQR